MAKWDDTYHVSVGARPARAALITAEKIEDANEVAALFTYGSNFRASKEYRRYIAGVLIERIYEGLEEKG